MDLERLRALISGLSKRGEPTEEFHRLVAQTTPDNVWAAGAPDRAASSLGADSPVPAGEVAGGTVEWGLGADDTIALDVGQQGGLSQSDIGGDVSTEASPERYLIKGLLGRGGMGEVRQVFDRTLGRVVAMKVIHRDLMDSDGAVVRFLEEAQVLAQLVHPHIIPMYDIGILPSGRLYFTMSEIRGSSLLHLIGQVHRAAENDWSKRTDEGWTLHRLVTAFHDVCNAVAYAHEQGVIHRDLKPENVMIGSFGEVLVVDWGLAKVITAEVTPSDPSSQQIMTARSETRSHDTMVGVVAGTPMYMAPEQARGQTSVQDVRTDIYSLGAILYELLRGRPPFGGPTLEGILARVVAGEALPFDRPYGAEPSHGGRGGERGPRFVSCAGVSVPSTLAQACTKAMSVDPDARFQRVGEFASVIQAWLDGTKKRELGLELVRQAQALQHRVDEAAKASVRLQDLAAQTLSKIPLWHPESEKYAGWALETRAQELRIEVKRAETEQGQLLHSALAHKGDLQVAHVALAERCLRLHAEAEATADRAAVYAADLELRAALSEVSHDRPERVGLVRYLAGDGTLSLSTSPPGADVELLVHRSEHRRRVLHHVSHLGHSPVVDHPVPMGSYVARLRKEGFHDLDYPVAIQRQGVWDTLTASGEPGSVPMLPLGTLGPEDCYVAAGWCWLGGDPLTPNSLPKQRVWVDGFVIRRFSVTHREYLEFVNALLRAGDRQAALVHVPRQQTSDAGELGAMVYRLDDEGEFTLPDASLEGAVGALHPVTLVKWDSARAYAQWLRTTTKRPWRLPMEFEWEKAARGVDGRCYPWGDRFDPSRSCMKDSHDGPVKIQSVDSFPVDRSVYGVRGTAGNTRDWCLDKFREEGPPLDGGRLLQPSATDLADTGFKSTRGGSYGNSAARARSADRDWWFPDRAYVGRGLRVVWGIDDAASADERLLEGGAQRGAPTP